MNHSLKLLLFLGMTFSSLVRANSLGLKDIIKEAIQSSPTYKISVANLSTKKLQQKNSFSTFLPSLDIQAIQGYQDGESVKIDDDWSSELKLSLTSQIYNNGINFLNYDKSKLALSKVR